MSRIYDALQRAHRDREKAEASEQSHADLPTPILANTEPIGPETEDAPAWEAGPASSAAAVAKTPAFSPVLDPSADLGWDSSPELSPQSATHSALDHSSVFNSAPARDRSPLAGHSPAPSTYRSPAVSGLAADRIAQHAWKPNLDSLPALAERGSGVEQFRRLRSRIYQAHYEAPLKTILIGSGMPAEGKSFIAANLAISLAGNTDNRVLLIDGDLRRPTLHHLLGAPNTVGLADFLEGTADLADILQRDASPAAGDSAGLAHVSNLAFISSGKPRENSSELVANHRIDELIAAVSGHFDWILIDSPPMLAVADAADIARAADAVLLVARGAKTPYTSVQRTQAILSNSRIIGFVLNALKDMPRSGTYSDSYYYDGQKRITAPGGVGNSPQ